MGEFTKAFTTSSNQEWETPKALFNAIQIRHNIEYDCDMAATKENSLCKAYLTKEYCNEISEKERGYSQWERFLCPTGIWQPYHNLWCNPPYGDKDNPIEFFVRNAVGLAHMRNITFLLPANKSDQPWFFKYCHCFYIEFVSSRVNFLLHGKPVGGNSQGSILLHAGPKFKDRAGTFGTFNWREYKKVMK